MKKLFFYLKKISKLKFQFKLPNKNRVVLYDEDGDGGFYQLYSQPFAGGIFIEITQRRDGYAGYGAPNAPFRIAAQKRLFRPKGMPRIAAL